ncbi:hypothetical protein RRG08_052357 [Elysia crispata]|uniref:Uncharacterized protein n=1 Tax=Elysia crispata TaxID=231223 RepID=A0AAE1A7K6_9GAST|nr:hypothetical protein RRG08_052357 [Elysia crispata]
MNWSTSPETDSTDYFDRVQLGDKADDVMTPKCTQLEFWDCALATPFSHPYTPWHHDPSLDKFDIQSCSAKEIL